MQFIKFSLVAINLGAAGYTLYEWKKMDYAMRVFALVILIMTFIAAIPGFVQGAMYVWEGLGAKHAYKYVTLGLIALNRNATEYLQWSLQNALDAAVLHLLVGWLYAISLWIMRERRLISTSDDFVQFVLIFFTVTFAVSLGILLIREFPPEKYLGHF